MFGKLTEVQQRAEELKSRLESITVEGVAGDGDVKIIASGNKNIRHVHISDELMQLGKKEELEDLLIVAIGRAMQQAESVSSAEMKNLMGSMIPGLGGMFGK
jgi:DNA-binding YbaB/EbfC family protein